MRLLQRCYRPLHWIAIGIGLLALPFIIHSIAFLGPSWVRILSYTMLYIMLALGLNIVVGYAGLLDLGYIAFYAIGAYLYAILSSPHLFEAQLVSHALHWPFWIVIPLCALCAGAAGIVLGAPTLKLRGDYLAIVTLGFGEIIRIFINNLDRPINFTNGPQGINHIQPLHLGSYSLKNPFTLDLFGLTLEFNPVINHYLVFLGLTIGLIFISRRLENSRIGRAWMALREDEIAAEAMGLNKRNLKLCAFGMGATFGGISGALFASFQGFVSPESFVLMESIMVLAMVVLGGMGGVPGVVLGAVILSTTPELFRDLVNWLQPILIAQFANGHNEQLRNLLDASTLRMLVFGFALVLVMRFRPQGLWPAHRRGRPDAPLVAQQSEPRG